MICPDCATTLETDTGRPWCPTCDHTAMPTHILEYVDNARFRELEAQAAGGFYQVVAPGGMMLGVITPAMSRWAAFRGHTLVDNFNYARGEWHEPELLGLTYTVEDALALFY